MGNRFSSAEKDIDKTAKQIIKKNKEVSFPENPLTETWSQSPRTSDEFYNFNSKTDANHSQKKTRTTKEKREKQRTRSRAINRYYEIKKGTDVLDFIKDFKKSKPSVKNGGKKKTKKISRKKKTKN
jgi:hypothetical protein|tara:strand:- start:624 stop:1001 length:378 start_codon:yes stop_codon:yes gene_type:complete